MPDLFQKFQSNLRLHEHIVEEIGLDPFGARIQSVDSPTRVTIAGRSCVQLGSNNYLGLTFDPEAIEQGAAALHQYGTGTTGSRAANGSYGCHQDLEEQVKEFFGRKHALLYTTGYLANTGFLSTIADKEDAILLDADCHASIYDGVRLNNATVYRFRHNDADDLDKRLRRLPPDQNKLVVTEGIFSMLGDRANLTALVEVARKHRAYIMVDEAHSLGVLGKSGRGLAEELGLEEEVDFIVSTFSKSAGAIGGVCASNHSGLEALRFSSRPYLFTASLPPSVVATVQQTLRRIRREPGLRSKLHKNATYLYNGLKAQGFKIGPDTTPIISVRLPSQESGLRAWKSLVDRGVYVNLAMSSAIPGSGSLLRCSVCAAHSRQDLDHALEAFAAINDTLARDSALAASS